MVLKRWFILLMLAVAPVALAATLALADNSVLYLLYRFQYQL